MHTQNPFRGLPQNSGGECLLSTEYKYLNPYSITLCEGFFDLDDFASIPVDVGPQETSQSLIKTSGATLLAEMLVLISTRGAQSKLLNFSPVNGVVSF